MNFNVALVGATGNVGQEMLTILEERMFPVGEVFALASRQSVGREVSFGDKTLKCRDLATFDFSQVQIALFAAGGSVAKEWAPKAAAAGAVVIDNSSHFRMDPDVPLIVPEVNADEVAGFSKKNIIANPNCSTAQLVVALKPLHDAATIKRVVVSTYQSTSGLAKPPWTSFGTKPKRFTSPTRRSLKYLPSKSPLMSSPISMSLWKTALLKKNGR